MTKNSENLIAEAVTLILISERKKKRLPGDPLDHGRVKVEGPTVDHMRFEHEVLGRYPDAVARDKDTGKVVAARWDHSDGSFTQFQSFDSRKGKVQVRTPRDSVPYRAVAAGELDKVYGEWFFATKTDAPGPYDLVSVTKSSK